MKIRIKSQSSRLTERASLWTRVCVVLSLFGLLAFAHAQNSAPEKSSLRQWAEQDYLLGTWGGLRTNLAQRGLDFEFLYAGSNPNTLNGGLKKGGVYQGAFLMMLDLDSQRLAGYPGGTFHASGISLHGHKPFSDAYIGDLNKVNLIDFRNAARVWELWYRQKLFDGKLTLKVGKLCVDQDFIVPEFYGSLGQLTLLNQTFFYPTMAFNLYDIPGLPPKNHILPSTPYSAPGAMARWQPAPEFYAQFGVYGNGDYSHSGSRFHLDSQEGLLSQFEVGYRLNPRPEQQGLEGSFKLGGYYHSGDFVNVYDGVTWAFYNAIGLPAPSVRNHSYTYSYYGLAEQQVFREKDKKDPAKEGLLAFLRFMGAPSDRSLAEWSVDGGLVYRGLIPGRNWDSLTVGASYMQMSRDIRRAQWDANAMGSNFELVDHETVLEASYKIQATAWWTIQPSIQRVIHPGGSGAIQDATVFILFSTLRF